jgi:hypothetical protein
MDGEALSRHYHKIITSRNSAGQAIITFASQPPHRFASETDPLLKTGGEFALIMTQRS